MRNKRNKAGTMELSAPFEHHLENPNSDMVAFLLTPNAQHNHGSEYLKLFLEEVGIVYDNSDLENAKITREHSADARRIDILIELPSKTTIVESKIHTRELDNQLNDYYEFVKDKFKKDIENIHGLLLTKFPQQAYFLSETNTIELDNRFRNITWGKRFFLA